MAPPLARHWAFTVWPKHLLNHESLDSWFEFAKTNTAGVTYLVIQHETGTKKEGHHVQGFITLATKIRPTPLGSKFQVKPEAFQLMMKKSTPQKNRAYCTDDSKRLVGTEFFEYGTVPGKETPKLESMCDLVKAQGLKRAIESDPATFVRHCNGLATYDLFCKRQKTEGRTERPLEVFVVYGDPGSGKSYWARNFDKCNCWPLPDIEKGSRLNIDGYNGQRTLIIEDYEGELPYRSLLKVLDVYNADFNTKGAYDCADWRYVIITANMHPCRWYDDRKDPWGLDIEGPLQRRIHTLIECTGVYPNSTFTWNLNGEQTVRTPSEMPLIEDLMAYHAGEEQEGSGTTEQLADSKYWPEETVSAAARPAPPTTPSNASPLPPEDDFLKALEQDFAEQDEHAGNDFMGAVDLSTAPEPFDPDGLTFGFDGDVEPLRSVDLMRFDVI